MWLLKSLILFFVSQTCVASAWVKTDYDHYAKIFFNLGSSSFEESQNSNIEQNIQNIGLYAETGIGFLPWKSQLSLSLLHKTIERTYNETGEAHSTSGFGDIRLIQKHKISSSKLNNTDINFILAAKTGLILPTTSKELRAGNDERESEIASGNTLLLSSIDRGELGYIYGAVATVSRKNIWLNLGQTTDSLSNGEFYSYNFNTSIGVGLPLNSWFQLSASWNKSAIGSSTDSATSDTDKNLIITYSASLGVTVYRGFALEAAYDSVINSDKSWSKESIYTIGLSHRTL